MEITAKTRPPRATNATREALVTLAAVCLLAVSADTASAEDCPLLSAPLESAQRHYKQLLLPECSFAGKAAEIPQRNHYKAKPVWRWYEYLLSKSGTTNDVLQKQVWL